MFMIFLIIYFDEGLSNLRSYKNDNKESDDVPRSSRVLIERLINLMLENVGMRSDVREWYFAFFRMLLIKDWIQIQQLAQEYKRKHQ